MKKENTIYSCSCKFRSFSNSSLTELTIRPNVNRKKAEVLVIKDIVTEKDVQPNNVSSFLALRKVPRDCMKTVKGDIQVFNLFDTVNNFVCDSLLFEVSHVSKKYRDNHSNYFLSQCIVCFDKC